MDLMSLPMLCAQRVNETKQQLSIRRSGLVVLTPDSGCVAAPACAVMSVMMCKHSLPCLTIGSWLPQHLADMAPGCVV